MHEELRLCFLGLYAVGPVVAIWALLRRRRAGSTVRSQVNGWRWYVPPILLPVEWLVPTVLLLLGLGEFEAGWYPVRLLGLALGLGGAGVLVWASASLGQFLIHEAAILQNHALITSGPYRLVRHPIYSGYLALLMGSGVATLNVWLLLLWPFSLGGILIQAGSEERLLESKFGHVYTDYAARTGRLVPRSRGAAG